MATATVSSIQTYLGAKADYLLGFDKPKISKDRLHLPGPDFVDKIFGPSDRNPRRQLRQKSRLLRRRKHRQAGH